MLETFGVVGFGLGFILAADADDEAAFGDVDAGVVLGTHHKPSLYSVVVCNCLVVLMGGLPLVSYDTGVKAQGCVPRRQACLVAMVS